MRGTTSLGACALALLLATHLAVGEASARTTAQAPSQVTVDDEPAPIEERFSHDSAEVMRADPGWYHATMEPAEVISYFRVERTLPGADVTVGLLSRPTADEGGGHYLELALETSDGVTCEKNETWITDDSAPRLAQYVSVSSSSPELNAKQARKCAQEDRFVLAFGGSVSETEAEVDFLVHEEPPIDNLSELPGPASPTGSEASSVPAGSSPDGASETEIEGSTQPLRSEPLEPGSYRTTISSGEQLYFRVDADWGQAVSAHVRAGSPPSDGRDEIESGEQHLAGQLVSPRFGTALLSDESGDDDLRVQQELSLGSSADFRLHSPRVSYRNREVKNPAIRNTSVPGPYFLVLTMSDAGVGYELPIQLELAAQGESQPAPVYRDRTEPIGPLWPEPDNTMLAWMVLGGGALLFIGGGVILLTTRRRKTSAVSPSVPLGGPTPVG